MQIHYCSARIAAQQDLHNQELIAHIVVAANTESVEPDLVQPDHWQVLAALAPCYRYMTGFELN